LHNPLLRYRRQDRGLKIGVATTVAAIGMLFLAPTFLDRSPPGEIPLFKVHRPDLVAQR
jgi:hypothetical protein